MKHTTLSQAIIGSIIICFGLGFLLSALHLWPFSTVIAHWWPVLIIALGLASFVNNPGTWLWSVFLMGAGGLLLFQQLHVTTGFSVWDAIWPVAVILVGLSFFSGQLIPRPKPSTDDTVNLAVAFSGVDSLDTSDHFKGGRISALFGGAKLDLRQAHIEPNANLDVFTTFGGAEIRVPKNTIVRISGLPIFGGFDDKTHKPALSDGPTLDIHATCLFGGVAVKN